jgi:hypothetical protein
MDREPMRRIEDSYFFDSRLRRLFGFRVSGEE